LSEISFENYGRLARELNDTTEISGRYVNQSMSQRKILPDLVSKLQISPPDKLLEIGCNVGNLLIPLSFLVDSVTGIDHASCLQRLTQRFHGENVRLVPGNFLEVTVEENFSKVLCYSVLHYLSSKDEVLHFIAKSLDLLAIGGKALFGDIPNQSKKERFLQSESGKELDRKWRDELRTNPRSNAADLDLQVDTNLVQFNDDLMFEICRKCKAEGFEACILPQPSDLPFGNTREDILVTRLP
jgi:cyclopropane fatty-acyl-phospholipid synthase-like methyltransferase